MAAATTALVRGTGTTGGVMMLPTGAVSTGIPTGCAGQSPQASFYPSQQSACSYLSLATTASSASSANGRLPSNHSYDSVPTNFYPQQPLQNYSLQRSFYQNLTPEPVTTGTTTGTAAVANTVGTHPQQTNISCESLGSIPPAAMSTDFPTNNTTGAVALADLNSQSLSVRRPSSGSSRSRPSSACSSATSVQAPSTTTVAVTSVGPVNTNMNAMSTTNATNSINTSAGVTKPADILVIRDPFEEEDFSRTRSASSTTQLMLNQRPPQYINTGNPIDSGGHLDLPRHLRIPYPDSAYRACAAANKNLANYRIGAPLFPFMASHPGIPGPRPVSLFSPNIFAVENSAPFPNLQQHQHPGTDMNFGMLRNNRVQGNASPGCQPSPMPTTSTGAPASVQGYGNPYCSQTPTPVPQLIGPAGCMQRSDYPAGTSGPYGISSGTPGQPYFGGQLGIRPESGAASIMPLNGGQMNPIGMVNMNGERMGPVMGITGVGQQPNGGTATGKKGSSKRSKANKTAVGMSAFSNEEQQLMAGRRKQQSLIPVGQQQPVVPGMVANIPVAAHDFYMSQAICGPSSGMPAPGSQPQQQPLASMVPATVDDGRGSGQFDSFDVRPSTSISSTSMSNYCSPLTSGLNASGTPPQQSTSQMIASSMMMTKGYGGFEQNGATDGFRSLEQSTPPCLPPIQQQRFGNIPQRNDCCTPDSQHQMHYMGARINGNCGGNGTNNLTNSINVNSNNANDDSFTVLNSSTSNRNGTTGNKHRCASCTEEFRSDRPGIQCTASGQGCRRFFHQECSELLPDAFRAIIAEPRAEWICPDCICRQHTQLTFS